MLVQRKCSPCEDEEEFLRKKNPAVPAASSDATDVPTVVYDVLRSAGQPFDLAIRTFMEVLWS